MFGIDLLIFGLGAVMFFAVLGWALFAPKAEKEPKSGRDALEKHLASFE